jgi:hypothetical protein
VSPVLAHFGHWYVSLPVFLGPAVLLFAWVYAGAWKEKRRKRKEGGTREARR